MTTHRKLLGAAALGFVLMVTASLPAQIQAGLIGKRTIGLSGFAEDLRTDNIGNGSGALLDVNLPICANFDFGLGGSYESISTYSFKEKQLFASLTAYLELDSIKPFVDASVGNIWQSSTVYGIEYRDNKSVYALGAGVELPFSDATAFVGRISYNKYFDSKLGHHWTYSFGLNHWLTEQVAGVASVAFRGSDSIIYTVGLVVRF
jgi:hypothetical protein